MSPSQSLSSAQPQWQTCRDVQGIACDRAYRCLDACRAFHLQALSLFRDAKEYDSWLRAIPAPVLAIAGDKDRLTPMVLSATTASGYMMQKWRSFDHVGVRLQLCSHRASNISALHASPGRALLAVSLQGGEQVGSSSGGS